MPRFGKRAAGGGDGGMNGLPAAAPTAVMIMA